MANGQIFGEDLIWSKYQMRLWSGDTVMNMIGQKVPVCGLNLVF